MQMVSYRQTMAGAKQIVAAPVTYKRPSRARPAPSLLSPEESRERALDRFRNRGMPAWARRVVEEVANRSGVSLEMIASDRRFHSVVHARDEAIYALKDRRAVLSMPMIGKWFNRDHTSIMYSIACHSERTGSPELTGFNLHRARKRKAAFNRWKRIQNKGTAS